MCAQIFLTASTLEISDTPTKSWSASDMGFAFIIPLSAFDVAFFFVTLGGFVGAVEVAAAFLVAAGLVAEAAADLAAASKALEPRIKPEALDIARVSKQKRREGSVEIQSGERESRGFISSILLFF